MTTANAEQPATLGAGDTDHQAAFVSALQGLHAPSPLIYWTDLLVSSGAGWTAFAVAVSSRNTVVTVVALTISMILLYRAHLFIHELSHAARRIGGFSAVWNLVAGFPLLVPAFFAVGVHRDHHRPDTYGTADDPEYLPFGHSRALIVRFLLLTIAFPWLMAIRLLLLAPIAMVVPKLQQYLERRASSLAMNPAFIRTVELAEHRAIMRQQLGAMALWAPIIGFLATGQWPLRTVAFWGIVATVIALINGLRALGAHRYLGDGAVFDREAQREDSIDTPGRWWTTIWAPVGHRYHALHHYAPGLPYHNLAVAYRRLLALRTPLDERFRRTTSPGLAPSLSTLWTTAGGYDDSSV